MKFLLAIFLIYLTQASCSYQEYGPIHGHIISADKIRNKGPDIIGGNLASIEDIPFQVMILAAESYTPSYYYVCGGTLVTSTAVLTAAHCIYDPKYTVFDVIMGTSTPLDINTGITIQTTTRRVHENFNASAGYKNDIGLLILPYPVQFSNAIKVGLLPKNIDRNQTFVGQMARTSGWGFLNDNGYVVEDLRYVDVPVIDVQNCINTYGPHNVDNTRICISTNNGLQGPCHGDSGGPLFLNHNGETIIIGIVSYGAKQGCESGFPDVYTRVGSHLEWIQVNGGPQIRY